MRLDRFTVKAQEALASAQTEAERHEHPEVTPEHLFKALLGQEGGVVPGALARLGANAAPIPADVERALASMPQAHGSPTQISPKLDTTLKAAQREAEALKDQYGWQEDVLV